MDCPDIHGLKFSKISEDAINDIRDKRELGDLLIKVIGVGHVANIFAGNGMLEATYSLYSTDFEAMARGMAGVPAITRASIQRVADFAWLNVSDYKEKQFWRAVSNGCTYPQ